MINEIVAKGRPQSQIIPAPSIQFPAPLIVKGVNLPAPGVIPWKAIGLDYVYLHRAENEKKA